MCRSFLCVVLTAAFMAVSLVHQPVVQGQATKKADKAGVIEIGEGKDGKFPFRP